jgi:hypothetical protein
VQFNTKKCSPGHSTSPLPTNDLIFSFAYVFLYLSYSVVQMASSHNSIAGDTNEAKKEILVSRRCIVLALVGSTPIDASILTSILKDGYLSIVKHWMDEILSGSVGTST